MRSLFSVRKMEKRATSAVVGIWVPPQACSSKVSMATTLSWPSMTGARLRASAAGLDGRGTRRQGDIRAQGRREAFPFEVDAGVVNVDLGAGDPGVVIARGERVQHMKNGVIAGQGEATRAVDGELDALADREFRVGGGNGQNGAAGPWSQGWPPPPG